MDYIQTTDKVYEKGKEVDIVNELKNLQQELEELETWKANQLRRITASYEFNKKRLTEAIQSLTNIKDGN